jgi:hypothetical protein
VTTHSDLKNVIEARAEHSLMDKADLIVFAKSMQARCPICELTAEATPTDQTRYRIVKPRALETTCQIIKAKTGETGLGPFDCPHLVDACEAALRSAGWKG